MKIHSIRLLAMCLSSIAAYGLVDPCLAQEGAKKDVVVRNENPNGLPVPSGDGWKPLFNGQNLDGWQQKNGWAVYRIDGNSIHGTTSKGSPNSFLCTAQDYADFELKFEVKVHNDLNSGVQIRSKSIAEKDNGRVHGPQVEIEASPGEAGYVYGEATGRNWISPTQPPHSHLKNNEWNQYHIRAKGKRIQTWINGKLVEDMTDPLSHDSGFIGLQVHSIGADQGPFDVRWRNIEIRELK
ncbi:MAG: DUF1080 domain-containing protein [Pirellula sp.]|jgi:hypothetical protein